MVSKTKKTTKYMYNTAGCLTNFVSNTDGRELNLSWDKRYQLTSVDSVDSNGVGGLINYDYNVLGQRIARKEITGSTTNIEYYVHDGGQKKLKVKREKGKIQVERSSYSSCVVADLDADKDLLRSYSYAPGYDNIISMTSYGDSETNTYFYIRNHNNSVVALIDENGSVAESYEYIAYGEVTVFDANGNELDESALGNRYTFQGREIDWSTGLYNFRARWYDPETGRWLSKDPIGINGGLNQYVFCGNNPVMFGDPEGESLWLTIGIIGVVFYIVELYIFNERADLMRERTKNQKKRFEPLQDKIDKHVEDGEYDIPLDSYNRDSYNETAGAIENMEEVMPPGTSLTGPANTPTSKADLIGTAINECSGLINEAVTGDE